MYFTIIQSIVEIFVTFDSKTDEPIFVNIDHVAIQLTNSRQKTDEPSNSHLYTIDTTEPWSLAQILLQRAQNPTTEQTNATLHITDVGLWI